MARAIVALCIAGLLAVSVSAFSSPNGGLLSDRESDKLVGGTDSGWCFAKCTNCNNQMGCFDKEVGETKCTEAGVDCPDPSDGYWGVFPEVCDDTMGNALCNTSLKYIYCAYSFECECKEKPILGGFECKSKSGTIKDWSTRMDTDPLTCDYYEVSGILDVGTNCY